MKFVFVVFVLVINVIDKQVDCNNEFEGFEFNEPVDYNTACGEPFDGESPWLVFVLRTWRAPNGSNTNKEFICNGNIIDKYVVLLPAQCLYNKQGIVEATDLSIGVGTPIRKEYACRNVIVHPQFDREKVANDIAILKIIGGIEFSSYVHPICLTNDISKFDTPQLGVLPKRIYEHTIEKELMTLDLPIISNDECIRSDPDFLGMFVTEWNFCAGYNNSSSDLCSRSTIGTSLSLVEETLIKFVWYLKGMLSFAKEDYVTGRCTDGYVLFTDVVKHYDWINGYRNSK